MSSVPPAVTQPRGVARAVRAALSVCLALTALLVASPAVAQDEQSVTVQKITFVGVTAIDESRLRGVLATRQNSWLPWGDKHEFDRVRFEADLKRIVAYYADRGYPDANIADYQIVLAEDKRSVSLMIQVDEGLPIRVSAVRFDGFSVLPPDQIEELADDVPLEVGDPRDRQVVATTREFAVNELREHGYPSARVSAEEAEDPVARTVTVTFTAEPGTLAYFGPVEVVGGTSVGSRIIERQLLFRPGDIYSRNAVRDSQRGLYGLQLFQFVNVETQVPEENPREVKTRVILVEGRHQRVNLGAGYGTEEKWRVDGSYRHVNFLGGARTAIVDARWSSLDRGVRAEFQQPYFFNPRIAMSAEAQNWYTFTPAYETVVTGGRSTFTYRFNRLMSAGVSLIVEESTSTISDEALNDPTLRDDLIAIGLDPTTNEQAGTMTPLALDFQRSTADNVLDPTRGYQFLIRTENAGYAVPGSFKYFSLMSDGRYYIPVNDRIVLAQRLQVATIDEADGDPANVPFSKRLFLGGASSIRGWGRFEISPLSSGLPIGGQTLMAFSVEARARMFASLGAVLFVDTGNVWIDDWSMQLDDLRSAVGFGIRYNTPVGPIRLDWGYQLNPIDDLLVNGEPQSRRYRIHFSIGQAF